MTIETSNEHQRAFSDSQMDERVVWDDNQRADLDDDLEKYLVEAYDVISFVDEDAIDETVDGGIDEERGEDDTTVEERAASAVEDLEQEDSDESGGDEDLSSESEAEVEGQEEYEYDVDTEVVGDDGKDD